MATCFQERTLRRQLSLLLVAVLPALLTGVALTSPAVALSRDIATSEVVPSSVNPSFRGLQIGRCNIHKASKPPSDKTAGALRPGLYLYPPGQAYAAVQQYFQIDVCLPGRWLSSVAIQERVPSGDWTTVAKRALGGRSWGNEARWLSIVHAKTGAATFRSKVYGRRHHLLSISATVQITYNKRPVGTWLAVSANEDHACGIRTDRHLWCWGGNWAGQLGFGVRGGFDQNSSEENAVRVTTPGTWLAVSVGYEWNTCGIKSDHTLWCWGYDIAHRGQYRWDQQTPTPTRIGSDSDWASFDPAFGCGSKLDGTTWCWGWGEDQYGALTAFYPLPIPVDGTVAYSSQAAMMAMAVPNNPDEWGDASCAIKADDGTLWCLQAGKWLHPFVGQTPPPLIQFDTPAGPLVDLNATCALAADHTIWCLRFAGDGTHVSHSRLTQTGGNHRWAALVPGRDAFSPIPCALDARHRAWCWGYNRSGEVGDGTTRFARWPTQVSGGGAWSALTGQGEYGAAVCGLKTDHTRWCWGDNSSGQLGVGRGPEMLKPTHVSGEGKWRSITSACGIRSDGSLWCWGPAQVGPGVRNRLPVMTP